MTKAFNASMIVPASKSVEFGIEGDGKRTAKTILLEGLERQAKLFKEPKLDGKRWFSVGKSEVAFSLRVANRPLKLVGDETRVAVPVASFEEALLFYKAEVEAGRFDQQLAALDGLREQRTAKLRNTRATRKAEKEAKAS